MIRAGVALCVTLLAAEAFGAAATINITSAPAFYLQGQQGGVVVEVSRTTPWNWSTETSRRISLRLSKPAAGTTFHVENVRVAKAGGAFFDVTTSALGTCSSTPVACVARSYTAACSTNLAAGLPASDMQIETVALVDIGNGDLEVDVIPSAVMDPGVVMRVEVSFTIDAAAPVSTASHRVIGCSDSEPTWPADIADPTTHPIEARAITTLSVSAPSPVVRGQSAPLSVQAFDQNGTTMSTVGVSTILTPPAEGALQGGAFVPAVLPRGESAFATVQASAGAVTASTVIEVARGAITRVQLEPASATINPGASQDFSPRGFNAFDGEELLSDADVTYSLSPANIGTVSSSGVVSINGGIPPAPLATLSAALGTQAGAQAQITVPRLPLTSCALVLDRTTLGPADRAVASVSGSDATMSYDLSAESTLSWTPPDALSLRANALVPQRPGPLAVEVRASNPACPGGSATASLQLRAAMGSDIVSLAFDTPSLALLVGAVRTVSVSALRADGTSAPLEPDVWEPGPGVSFSNTSVLGSHELRVDAAGETFVTVRYAGLSATLPITVDERYLSFEWRMSRTSARQGELVTATLDAVVSNARAPHPGVRISVAPPAGLRVVGAVPSFTLDIDAGSSRRSYSIAMLAAARAGVWKLQANATEPGGEALAASVSPSVRIVEDPEFAEALLVGRVYHDQNGNGRSDEGEPGIAGVTLGLSAGLFVTTDASGNYHVPALQPGTVVVKIDTATLPHPAPLTSPERMPIVLTPGQIFRADFGVNLDEPAPPTLARDTTRGARLVRAADGSRIYVLPVRMEHAPSDTKKSEAWSVRVPITSVRNEALVQASGDNGTTARYRVVVRRFVSGENETYVADPPELLGVDYPKKPESTHFLVAIGEGILGFEPKRSWPDGLYWDGKLAFAYRGRILGKYLIDAGGDTTWREMPTFFQRDTRRIFRNLDPDAYYPVYGDASQIVDERASGQKLYVRVEAGPLSAQYGAFQTGLNQVQYGRYDRSLVGASAKLLLDRPSGDAHKVIVFYAKPDTQRAHDELLLTGGSLYYLSRRNAVEGSEQIWLERRQQRTGLVRERRMLKPGSDYQVDYVAGRVLLERAPASMLPSSSALRQNAADGDEGWLLVDYETVGDLVAAGQDDVVGGRIAERPLRGLELGASGVTELRRGSGNYYLVGGDLSFSLWEPLKLRAEYAHSENALQARGLSLDGGLTYAALPENVLKGGDAYSARLSFEKWDVRAEAYGKLRTLNFNDTSNAPGERSSQAGFTLRSPNWHGFMALLAFDDTRRDASYSVVSPQLGAVRLGRQTTELELSQAVGPVTLLASARYARIAPGFGEGNESVVAGGVVWRIIPELAIGAVHQQPIARSGERLFDSLGRDTQLLARLVLRRVEIEASGGYGERGPSGRGTVLLPVNTDTTLTAGVLFGGTQINQAVSVGLRRRTGSGTFAYADNQFSRTAAGNLQSQVGGLETKLFERHMLSASFEVGKRNPGTALEALIERYGAGVGYAFLLERFQLRSRLEGRIESIGAISAGDGISTNAAAPSGTRTLSGFVRADWKATDTLSLAAWTKGSGSASAVDGAPIAEFFEAAAGFAYRPSAVAKPTLFGRYAYNRERLPLQTNPLRAVSDAHIASLALTFDPWKYVGFLAKIAGRVGTLTVPGLGAQNLLSVLGIPRVNVHLTKMFDVSGEYRACLDAAVGTKHGALAEVSALVAEFVRIGAGYNFSTIDETGVDCQSQKTTGFFVRAQAFY